MERPPPRPNLAIEAPLGYTVVHIGGLRVLGFPMFLWYRDDVLLVAEGRFTQVQLSLTLQDLGFSQFYLLLWLYFAHNFGIKCRSVFPLLRPWLPFFPIPLPLSLRGRAI